MGHVGFCTHLLQRGHRHSGCYRHDDVPLRNVKGDFTEDDWNQVRLDCDEDHVRGTNHLQVGMSGGNPELLRTEEWSDSGWKTITITNKQEINSIASVCDTKCNNLFEFWQKCACVIRHPHS